MAEGKTTFIVHCDLIHTVEKLSDIDAGQLFKHMLRYTNDLNPATDNIIVDLVFEPIKQTLKRELKVWEETCKRNKINGLKGGRPKNPKEPKKPTGLFGNPKNPEEPRETQANPKNPDSVSVNVNVNDNVNVNVNEIKNNNIKRKFLDFVFMTNEENNKLLESY